LNLKVQDELTDHEPLLLPALDRRVAGSLLSLVT
jgi:hypothetical protein